MTCGTVAFMAVDWAVIPGPRWYQGELAAAAAGTVARADTPSRVVQAVAELRFAVGNDHRGTLYPAAVPATGVFVGMIVEQPGGPRGYALNTLLDWWGCFRPEPGYDTYDDAAAGPVEITEGIMQRVRQAAPALTRLTADFRAVEHRRAITEVLRLLALGWVVSDG